MCIKRRATTQWWIGAEVRKDRFPTTREDLDEFASDLIGDAKVAIEASTSGIFVYEYLDGKGIEVHLAHPALVKPFAKKHVKTDKVDWFWRNYSEWITYLRAMSLGER